MIELVGVRKFFASNGVEALSGADFDLRAGEIHALVGENGAGKSTLMHVLSGNLEPSAGKLLVDGEERHFASPADALASGIGMLRQHPRLVGGFTLWEDCALGAEPRRFGLLDRKAARNAVVEASERWGFGLDADARVDTLAVSQRQKAAILALLLRGVRCLILDEPTAVLAPAETEHLFDLLRALRREGKSIVLISHKLTETLSIADRVTVLRRGRTVATRSAADADPAELTSLMFAQGDAKPEAPIERAVSRSTSTSGRTVLKVRGLAVKAPGRPHLRGVDLEVKAGRVLGVAGVRDSGLETLELALAGLLPIAAGGIELNGKRMEGKGTAAFRAAGAVYVPADRMGMAVAPRLSIADNIAVHAHRRARRGFLGRLGFLDRSFLRSWTSAVMEEARVSGDPLRTAETFSGGMLQRIITAREMAETFDLVIMAEPGWGLDAASRLQLGRRIRRIAETGRSALLLSTDVDELVSLSDEIAILRDGVIVAKLAVDGCADPVPAAATLLAASIPQAIGAAMIGTEACVDR
jgi:simple sugar transport system ATP-binding protein